MITAIHDIVSIINDSKFQTNNATLHFSNDTKTALQLVTDILHTITEKPELPSPSPFLYQIKATLNNMNKAFKDNNKIPDNIPFFVNKPTVPLPRVEKDKTNHDINNNIHP